MKTKTTTNNFLFCCILVLCIILIGGFVWYLYDYRKKVDEAIKAHHKFLASTTNINGLNMSENATETDKYMAIINDKNMSVNQSIGEHMRLMEEKQKKSSVKNVDPYKTTQIIGKWQMKTGIVTIYKSLGIYYIRESYYDWHFSDAEKITAYRKGDQMAFGFVEDNETLLFVKPDGLYVYMGGEFAGTFPNIK
jgi:hypothetical protein